VIENPSNSARLKLFLMKVGNDLTADVFYVCPINKHTEYYTRIMGIFAASRASRKWHAVTVPLYGDNADELRAKVCEITAGAFSQRGLALDYNILMNNVDAARRAYEENSPNPVRFGKLVDRLGMTDVPEPELYWRRITRQLCVTAGQSASVIGDMYDELSDIDANDNELGYDGDELDEKRRKLPILLNIHRSRSGANAAVWGAESARPRAGAGGDN